MLEVVGVSKVFGGLRALDNVSFVVEDGEAVGLIGPNGSGKTTAFNIIAGAMRATSGSIIFRGRSITDLPTHQIARQGVARTFQLVRPFLHLTTLENVTAGVLFGDSGPARREALRRAAVVLERVGLLARAKDRASDLSLAERKWLEVARALAAEPKLLLLDEFMAGLTRDEMARAVDLIRDVNSSGITVVVVEHIIKAVTATCSRVIVLDAGAKLADGPISDVVQDPAVIAAYLGSRRARGG